ncbi:MAG: YihY/virulence factor BrkB family protein [Ruminiclostridium sp.]
MNKLKAFFVTIYVLCTGFAKRLRESCISAFAGQAALFIIISFFPFIMLLISLIQFLPFTLEEVQQFTVDFLSPTLNDFLVNIIKEIISKSSISIISITSVTVLWSASKGFLAIIRGLNSVYSVNEKRGYVKLRLTTVLYTIVTLIIILVTLGLLVFGSTINNWIVELIPQLSQMSPVTLTVRWLIGLCMLILFFMFIYTVIPERKTRFVNELPGAVFSSLGWLIFSGLYSFYIDNFANYSYIYGSLTTVVLLLLWLYFCMYILFLGAAINNALQDKTFMPRLKEAVMDKYRAVRKKKKSE